MGRQQTLGWSLVALVVLQMTLPALALPQLFGKMAEQGRKFAVKPNSNKKVITDNNEIAPTEQSGSSSGGSGGGFPWGTIFNTIIQMFLGGSSGGSGIDKADSPGSSAVQGGGFNWMNLVNLGLRLMLSTLNSGSASGLDKADSGSSSSSSSSSSPMQAMLGPLLASFLGGQDKADVASLAKQAGNLIQLISSLMDALKVSFSQRSSHARSLGTKDPFSDAAVAAVTIMKGYINTQKHTDEVCMQRVMCEANHECSQDAPDSGYLFCQLGTYAASYLLERSTFTPLDAFTQAGRQGRTGESCAQIYQQCNEL